MSQAMLRVGKALGNDFESTKSLSMDYRLLPEYVHRVVSEPFMVG